MDSERVWLEHPETGGRNAFPVAAAEAWMARGWVPCDEPVEANPHEAFLKPEPEPVTERVLYNLDAPDQGGEAFIPIPARRRQK